MAGASFAETDVQFIAAPGARPVGRRGLVGLLIGLAVGILELFNVFGADAEGTEQENIFIGSELNTAVD